MGESPRHQLARRLASAVSSHPAAASVRQTSPTGDLHLEVRGVGPIDLPVTAAQAKELRLVARPARYGLGADTLLDRSVRDTWEVPRSRVKIDRRRWNNTLAPMLDRLARGLGLPEGCRLKAELHSMLVYEQSQFFAPHQDSERSDDMIASLVVMLPSNASGGDLVVGLGEQATAHRPSRTALTFIAFYSDTVHEIRPVTSGYRVVLTYNLLVQGSTSVPSVDIGLDDPMVDQLVGLLDAHFSQPAEVPSWQRSRSSSQPPDRLVYLLDHQYTERGLAWDVLKGTDARRATALRAAAKRGDCDLTLALAEVHETWHADEDWDYRGRDHRYEPQRGVRSVDGYELVDLVEDDVTLRLPARQSDGSGVAVEAGVDHSERCESIPSVELDPYDSHYEGYMGNYGNTMDRWYHRGAVVVWPTSRSYVIRARANPLAGLIELITEAAETPADPTAARAKATLLAPFWSSLISSDLRPSMAGGALMAAKLVDDPDLASMLIAPFAPIDLGLTDASTLVELVDHYGLDWAEPWLTGWAVGSTSSSESYPFTMANRSADRPGSKRDWVCSLSTLCLKLASIDRRAAAPINRRLVEAAATWLANSFEKALMIAPPSRQHQELSALGAALRAVLEATAVASAVKTSRSLTDRLCGAGTAPALIPVLVAAVLADGEPPDDTNGLAVVGRYCIEQLEARLAVPARIVGDWSIARPKRSCNCDDCQLLYAFLEGCDQRQKVWPLAKPRRQHIHYQIDAAELPVTHETRREGSPHKLVLAKFDDLVERESHARSQVEIELAELRRRTSC